MNINEVIARINELAHKAKTEGEDNDHTKGDLLFTLMHEENGVNLPVAEKWLTVIIP